MFEAILESRIERLVDSLKSRASLPLRIELWNGRRLDLGRDPTVTVRIPSPSALRYFRRPDLNRLGEAYVEGHINVDGSVHDMFRVAETLAREIGGTRVGIKPSGKHTRTRDRQAIEHHYDVSNEFYRLFLDANMVYSCAYFRSDSDTLEQAQENKLDHILTKAMVKPGQSLLDIGCGWGALVIRAAQKFGARAVGITLSKNQYEHARRRIEELKLSDRCEVRLQDYRDVPGERVFDRIVSVGMFEHVGLKNLPEYFRKIRALLKDDGVALNHGITSSDPDSRSVGRGASEFIHRYVFPHGELPHISLAVKEMAAAGLEVTDVESLRRHYARTCHEWASRLEANRARAIAAADERRTRIWQIYLAGCAYGFSQAWMNIYQVLACKAKAQNPLPLTRDYMYRQA